MVGRDDVPRSPLGRGVLEHLGERRRVGVPLSAGDHVGVRHLPVLRRVLASLQEVLALLLLGHVEEQLDDHGALLGQVPLPVVDLAVTLLPRVLRTCHPGHRPHGLGVDPGLQHVLVVRPVEDRDLAQLGQHLVVAPQVVVAALDRRRGTEAVDVDAFRVHPRQHGSDRGVLACRVDRLETDQDRSVSLGVELRLQLLELQLRRLHHGEAPLLAQLRILAVRREVLAQVDLAAGRHQRRSDERRPVEGARHDCG